MSKQKTLVLLGCGGHARSVASSAISIGFKNIIFVDKNARADEFIWGYPVLKAIEEHPTSVCIYMPCSGNNLIRAQQYEYLKSLNLLCATIISPSAIISHYANIGEACFIGHQAYVGPEAAIGSNTIINTGAIVEHECQVGMHSHIAIHATVAGRCTIGNHVFLGASSTVIDGISIDDHITLGANSTAINNLHTPGIFVGSPCKLKKQLTTM